MESNKKRILVFVDWFYPGFKAGGPIRSVINLVENLYGNFDFYIVTGDKDYHSKEEYAGVKFNQWNNYFNKAKVFYVSGSLSTSAIINFYKEVNPTVVYLNSMFSIPFAIRPLFVLQGFDSKIILAPRGMLASSALRIRSLKKKIFLNVFKFFDLPKKITFHATNESEAQDILKIFHNSNLVVAANLPKANQSEVVEIEKKAGALKLFSIARISPEKNLLFALNILSKVSAGSIEFNIYGTINDTEYWNKCLLIISKLPAKITVVYHGAIIPEEINDTIRNNHFLFMPTLGENYGHIIIESLSCGRPVIISDQTPWRELHQHNAGWDLSLNEVSLFTEIIQKLVNMDQEEFNNMTAASKRFAESVISNNAVKQQNVMLFS